MIKGPFKPHPDPSFPKKPTTSAQNQQQFREVQRWAKRIMLDAIEPEDIQRMTRTLVNLAIDGDVNAIKLLFTYVLPPTTEPEDHSSHTVIAVNWPTTWQPPTVTTPDVPRLIEHEPNAS